MAPQSVDELFPEQAKSVDELFPVEIERDRYRRQTLGTSPIQDLIFGGVDVNPVARVLDHFGQGARQGWGAEPNGLSEESANALKKAGIFNDYDKGQRSVIKAMNESMFRGAATYLSDPIMRGLPAGFRGVQEAIAQTGEELGQPKLGREAAGALEAFPAGFRQPTGAPGAGVAQMGRAQHIATVEAEIARARDLGVIGAGEGGWKGTAEVPAPTIKEQAAAIKPEVAVEAPKAEPVPAVEAAAPEAAPLDVHQVAREIAPDVFTEYDALTQRKDTFRRWISDLKDSREQDVAAKAPHAAEIADLEQRLADPETTPRLRKKYEARLEPLTAERDAFIENATVGDSKDMALVRTRLQEADYRMRDLAPEVSAAYRTARGRVPEPVQEPLAVEAKPAPEAALPLSEPVQAAPRSVEAPVEAAPQPVEAAKSAPVANIARDVTQKLMAAGRPAEEARAAAAVIDAYWQTRAERFEGAKGSAAEMYAKEAPEIKAGKGVEPAAEPALELAQTQRGRIRIREEGRNTITLMKDANASTFIHETGHDWLDRMMKDGVDPAAPASLVSDSDAVLKWLGIEKAENIKTRQHEKFARGFETYMMEGRAPSKELAGVFEKFKDWLTRIYETVARLKAPISDDIRDVFDRLLAKNPERQEPVIAPDREPAKAFADIHEADALNTPPEAAHPVAQTIRSERDRLATEQIPEENDARLEGVASGASRREAGGPQPARNVNEAGSATRETGNDQATGAVSEGGGAVAPESAGPSAQPRTEVPVSAQEPFKTESPLVDKAGNIRLDNLSTPEDVSQVIRDAAIANNDFIDARRGVVTDGQVLELADALGMDEGVLNRRKLGEAFNAEQIMAARKLLIQSATTVRDAMMKAAQGSEADILAYAEAKSRHRMIQEQVAGLTAEAGRALRAFRKLEGQQEAKQLDAFLKDATGKTLFQLQREAQAGVKLETPAQVSKFVHDTSQPKYSDMLLEGWITALLSGPKTHVANILGNTITGIIRPVETALASGIGKARNLATGTQDRVLPREAAAELYGAVQGAREGVVAAYKAYQTGEGQLTSASQVEKFNPRAIPSATINLFGKEREIGGKQARIPLRLLAAEDEFFKSVSFRGDIHRQAYAKAAKEGLPPEQMHARVAELSLNPTDEMIDAAKKVAEYQTFQTPLGKFGRSLQAISNAHPLLKVVLPFIRTPLNLLKYASERTPLGLFAQEVRDNLAGKNGAVARDTQLARMTLGTMVGVAAFEMASQGLITGGGPADPKEKAILKASGWQEYSVKIGDTYYSYRRLDPFSTILGVVSDAYELSQKMSAADSEKHNIPALVMGAISKTLLDKASLKGTSDLIQAATQWERFGDGYVRNLVGTVVPAISAQSAQTIDPVVREARTVLDNLKARTPGLSQTLMPKRDVWGEPMTREGGLGPDIASPIAESRLKNDPVNKALLAAHYYPSRVERKIRGIELTDQQYDDYARIAGRTAKVRLNAIVSMPGFSQMPEATRKELMTNAITSSREMARSLIMMQSPDIIKRANDAKLAKQKAN